MKAIKNALKNTWGLNKMQINLIIISTIAIIIQGIGFYLIDREKMRFDLFLLVIIKIAL
jgi:hypothetical protein